MNTEKMTELLKHFQVHGISHNPKRGIDQVIEFQDIIGRATQTEIADYEKSLDTERRGLYFFACMNCLSTDSAIGILKIYIRRRCICQEEKYYAEMVEPAEQEVYDTGKKLEECEEEKEALHKGIVYYKERAEHYEAYYLKEQRRRDCLENELNMLIENKVNAAR